MTSSRFLPLLGASFITIFAAFCLWQSPGIIAGKLSGAEIDHHLKLADAQLHMPEKAEVLKRVRRWAEADDGQPFYMLNLMRHHRTLRQFPGSLPFDGSPVDANNYYENKTLPMLVTNGGSLPFGSATHGQALIPVGADRDQDDWTRALVVRYTSRRAFLALLSDPAYAKVAPYKMMALDVLLVPTSGDIVLPDPRVMLGAILLCLFLLAGWLRSAQKEKKQ